MIELPYRVAVWTRVRGLPEARLFVAKTFSFQAAHKPTSRYLQPHKVCLFSVYDPLDFHGAIMHVSFLERKIYEVDIDIAHSLRLTAVEAMHRAIQTVHC